MGSCYELLKRRRDAKLSQGALAALAGVNKETIVRLERGQYTRGPGAATMANLARALDARVDEVFPELMGGTERVA